MKKMYKDVPVWWLKPKHIKKFIKKPTNCNDCIKKFRKIFVSATWRKGTEHLCKKYFKVGMYKPKNRKSRKSSSHKRKSHVQQRKRKSRSHKRKRVHRFCAKGQKGGDCDDKWCMRIVGGGLWGPEIKNFKQQGGGRDVLDKCPFNTRCTTADGKRARDEAWATCRSGKCEAVVGKCMTPKEYNQEKFAGTFPLPSQMQ